MRNIATITFSPCIDKSIVAPYITPDIKIRCGAAKSEAGGGGVNVARAIKKLGGNAMAIFPSGGHNGRLLRELLELEEVPILPIETSRQTRENIMVLDQSSKKQYRFVMQGEPLDEAEWKACLQAVEKIGDIEFIVASGSLPAGVPLDIYAMLARIAKTKKAKLMVDTSGEPLRHAMEEGVFLLKPNLGELAQLVNKKTLSMEEAIASAKNLISIGHCENMIVSMGPAGALLVTKEFSELLSAPLVEPASTVGAGDSLVAGMVHFLSLGKNLLEAACYGVAAGTAATLRPGTELCWKEDCEKLYPLVNSKKY